MRYMPELPEVETIRSDLAKKILRKEIVQVDFLLPRIIKGNRKALKDTLMNNQFTAITRKGKLMVFHIGKSDKLMLVHLKMTGQLIYQKGVRVIAGGHSDSHVINELPNRHSRVIFVFKDNSKLFFNDLRTFGYLELIDKVQLPDKTKNYGLDAINDKVDKKWFIAKVKQRKTSIKAVLLDQKLVAGIGNIYADEILFKAQVKPWRKANTLKISELENIFKSIRPILELAIKNRGTTFNNYRDSDGNKGNFVSKLKVFDRKGERCKRCKTGVIQKIKVAGRGTHYCDMCQK